MGVLQLQQAGYHTFLGQAVHRFAMDVDRTMMASDDYGSLLNKVYEMQCIREREMKLMAESTLSQSLPVQFSSEDSLFMALPAHNPGQANMMDHQLDSLASAMTDMCVEEDSPQTYTMTSDPYNQAVKRSDPVYLATATTFPLQHQQILQQQHQEQQMLHQQFLEQQQQWILQQQHLQQQQQLLQHHQQPALQPYQDSLNTPFKCEIGRGRILKRAN